MGVTVFARDGRSWEVRRVFWPRYRAGTGFDWAGDMLGGFDDLCGILAGIVLAIVAAVLVAIFLPLVVFIIELVVSVGAALVLIRGWRVVAESHDRKLEWRVRGIFKSRRAMKSIAAQLAAGQEPVKTW